MSARGPLIVRLCNWVGEAVLSLPTLTLLAEQGYELHLIGKRWACSLFEGHGWQVHVRPAKRADAIAQLRALRQALSSRDAGFARRPNYLLFTSSFSSALEARLAGLRPIGFRHDGRALLLAHGVPDAKGLHAADNYWRVGTHFVGTSAQRPVSLGLRPSEGQRQLAARLLAEHGMQGRFVILCPFSGAADTSGKKNWPHFPALSQRLLDQGWQVVLCPGPGEEAVAHQAYAGAVVLSGVDLGVYAALATRAGAVVSNDTGPGHLAAAVDAPLVSVLGPDAAPMWYAQGPHVTLLHPAHGWPSLQDVLSAVAARERV